MLSGTRVAVTACIKRAGPASAQAGRATPPSAGGGLPAQRGTRELSSRDPASSRKAPVHPMSPGSSSFQGDSPRHCSRHCDHHDAGAQRSNPLGTAGSRGKVVLHGQWPLLSDAIVDRAAGSSAGCGERPGGWRLGGCSRRGWDSSSGERACHDSCP